MSYVYNRPLRRIGEACEPATTEPSTVCEIVDTPAQHAGIVVGMLKATGCLIAVLSGLAVASGVAIALLDPGAVVSSGFTSAGCDGISAVYGRVGDRWTMSVRADACHAADPAALSSESTSFAVLGAAAWRTPGPSLSSVAITLGRSADRPDGREPPRTVVLTAEQAAARWGPRPAPPRSDRPLLVRAALGDMVWLTGLGAVALSCGVAAVLAARAARRLGVVAIWWR
jgi:hypothetical protein